MRSSTTIRSGMTVMLMALGLAGMTGVAQAQGPIRPRANPRTNPRAETAQNVLPPGSQGANQQPDDSPQQTAQVRPKANQKAKGKAKANANANPSAQQEQLLERFLNMTPNQRVRALAGLGVARRQRLLGMLAEIDAMPPEDRRLLRGRYQAFLALDMARRQALRAELRLLRGLSQAELRRRLGSDDAARRFSPAERRLMFQIAGEQAQ